MLLDYKWQNIKLQLNFIENTINYYTEKKDKSIGFSKLSNKHELVSEIVSEKASTNPEFLNIWTSIDLVSKLIEISESSGCYQKVRSILENPVR